MSHVESWENANVNQLPGKKKTSLHPNIGWKLRTCFPNTTSSYHCRRLKKREIKEPRCWQKKIPRTALTQHRHLLISLMFHSLQNSNSRVLRKRSRGTETSVELINCDAEQERRERDPLFLKAGVTRAAACIWRSLIKTEELGMV